MTLTGSCVGVEPRGNCTRGECVAADLEPFLCFGLGRRQGREQSIAENLELEIVEQRMNLLAVPRGQHQLLGRVRQGNVANHFGELTIEQDVCKVLA